MVSVTEHRIFSDYFRMIHIMLISITVFRISSVIIDDAPTSVNFRLLKFGHYDDRETLRNSQLHLRNYSVHVRDWKRHYRHFRVLLGIQKTYSSMDWHG